MSLEHRGFGKGDEAGDVLALTGTAGILAAGGEFVHHTVETVNGRAVRGLLGSFLSKGRLTGLSLGDGIALPAGGVAFFVLEQHGGQGLADMSFDVAGQHAQEDVGFDMVHGAVVNRTDADVKALDAPEGLFDPAQALVGAHAVFGVAFPRRFGCADDVDAVEARLARDVFAVAREGEVAVAYVEEEVFANSVL